jgi:hypothetical protein
MKSKGTRRRLRSNIKVHQGDKYRTGKAPVPGLLSGLCTFNLASLASSWDIHKEENGSCSCVNAKVVYPSRYSLLRREVKMNLHILSLHQIGGVLPLVTRA